MEGTLLNRIMDVEEMIENSGGLTYNKYSLGGWSPSKLKLLTQCPYQFYLKYILKVKPEDGHVQDTSMADVGTIAHRVLEHVVQGRSVDDAYRQTKMECCEVPEEIYKPGTPNITSIKWGESIVPLEMNILAFSERMASFRQNNKVLNMFTELRLGVTKDWKKTTFFAKDVYFRGIVDLVIEIDANPGYYPDILIIDHKHGGGEFGRPSTRNYQTQLNSYKPMYHYGYKPVSGATAGINFVKAGVSAYDEYVDAADIEGTLRKDIEWNIDGAVDTVTELGFFKHIRGTYCKWCEFDPQCKAGLLKPNELSTKKYFTIKKV